MVARSLAPTKLLLQPFNLQVSGCGAADVRTQKGANRSLRFLLVGSHADHWLACLLIVAQVLPNRAQARRGPSWVAGQRRKVPDAARRADIIWRSGQ